MAAIMLDLIVITYFTNISILNNAISRKNLPVVIYITHHSRSYCGCIKAVLTFVPSIKDSLLEKMLNVFLISYDGNSKRSWWFFSRFSYFIWQKYWAFTIITCLMNLVLRSIGLLYLSLHHRFVSGRPINAQSKCFYFLRNSWFFLIFVMIFVGTSLLGNFYPKITKPTPFFDLLAFIFTEFRNFPQVNSSLNYLEIHPLKYCPSFRRHQASPQKIDSCPVLAGWRHKNTEI